MQLFLFYRKLEDKIVQNCFNHIHFSHIFNKKWFVSVFMAVILFIIIIVNKGDHDNYNVYLFYAVYCFEKKCVSYWNHAIVCVYWRFIDICEFKFCGWKQNWIFSTYLISNEKEIRFSFNNYIPGPLVTTTRRTCLDTVKKPF